MATIDRLRVQMLMPWGGEGLTTFYATPGGGHQADVKTFYNTLKDQFAPGTQVFVPNSGEQIEDTTGDVVGFWTFGTSATYVSANASAYAPGVGGRIVWDTEGVVHGRRVTGSTYWVPLTVGAYHTDGSLTDGLRNPLFDAADVMRVAFDGSLLIWSRPWEGSPTNPARLGSSHEVTGVRVPDKVTTLRTRRT